MQYVEGAPGFTGGVLGVGLFAQKGLNDAVTSDGLFFGGYILIWKQLVCAHVVTFWMVIGTAICMFIVNRFGPSLTGILLLAQIKYI